MFSVMFPVDVWNIVTWSEQSANIPGILRGGCALSKDSINIVTEDLVPNILVC